MASASAARTLVALLVVSCLSGLVVANDAGSGGDVGNSTSTAYSLNATNATYFGNLTYTSDEDDYYSVSMPNNTGIYVELISPGYSGSNGTNSSSTCYNSSWPFYTCDFDLRLYNSSGTQLDSSLSSGGYDDVSSNGTVVGGTTVYIRAYHYDGDGQYALIINIFSSASTGGGGGNNSTGSGHDAGTGTDAGDTYSTAMTLSATNQTIWGDVHSSNDPDDYYRITIPAYHGFTLTLDWNGTSTSPDLDLLLYDANGTLLASTLFSHPEVLGPYNGSGGTTFNIRVNAWSGSGDYSLALLFDNLSSSPVYNQDDAGTGDDASDDYDNPTAILTTIGQNDFTGWASSSDDAVDQYSTAVPPDHGIAVSVSFNTGEINIDILLAIMPNPGSNIVDSSSTSSSPETMTSNGTYVGGEDVLIQIHAVSGEGYYNMTIWIFTLDTDGDGFYDDDEITCGSDPDNASSIPQDTDADGVCDVMDNDDDGDGHDDANDSFPLDDSEWDDTDNDGTGDNADDDDDGDGWTDLEENQCGTDPLQYSSQPTDTDTDGSCDPMDDDDDDDGYLDIDDAFPLDDQEWLDTDGDLIGDNADIDDDGDGFSDAIEATCGSDPLDANSLPPDTDQDGSCNAVDGDDDNDGFADVADAFPLDAGEWVDTDNDGIGNNADGDDDGDSVPDIADAFPLDASEWDDNDGDGIGDNADLDDDQDGWSDADEADCQTDSYSALSIPDDYDGDHVCDRVDPDDDGDGTDDVYDMFPFDATEWEDLDFDGIGNNADTDDDGDTWSDLDEPNCGTDPLDANSFPNDFDGDRICDPLDIDDDNDMVLDINDAFPFDPGETKDTDGDGIGNNADNDDDGDDWPDTIEALCLTDALSSTSVPIDTDGDGSCDVIDADDDNDDVGDLNDVFPLDPTEWEDRNGDGLGDNANPLSIIDHMKLNPLMAALMVLIILAAIGGSVVFTMGRRKGQTDESWKDDDYGRYSSSPEAASDWQDTPLPPLSTPSSVSEPLEMPPELPEIEVPEVEPETEPESEEPSLSDLTVVQLKAMASERGFSGFSKFNKSEIITLLETEPEGEGEPEPETIPPPPPNFERQPPPPPPGFEGMANAEPEGPVRAESWEDLPDGGDYVQTEPMQYVGEECGTWVRQDDDSWVKQ